MKFSVEKLPAAENEIKSLEQSQQDLLNKEYETIERQGIEFVRVRPIQREIFEIKSVSGRFRIRFTRYIARFFVNIPVKSSSV